MRRIGTQSKLLLRSLRKGGFEGSSVEESLGAGAPAISTGAPSEAIEHLGASPFSSSSPQRGSIAVPAQESFGASRLLKNSPLGDG